MDSSSSAETISPKSYALGVNVVSRDGMPATRPMYRRFEAQIPDTLRGAYIQGYGSYYNPSTGVSLFFCAALGKIWSFNPFNGAVVDLSAAAGLINDTTATHYFCQAESFLIINNGRDRPLIFDGVKLRTAGEDEVPVGTLMAYGQGRLFVASPDRRAVTAGDLVYGGSSSRVPILASGRRGANTLVNTSQPLTLKVGDTVTIMRHSSTPTIDGTWSVVQVLNAFQFLIPAQVVSSGAGGFVDKSNEGKESDLLRFTERRYLAETGTFRLPVAFGQITAMFFFPIQDTGTGQGDLFVSGQGGGCTFKVEQPRQTWLSIPFERVALTDIGVCGPRATAQVNGDVFFGARDGIRSYRNARGEFGQYGNSPLSAEMQRVMQVTRLPVLHRASMALFRNRLLYTTSAKILPGNDLIIPPRVIFQSLTVLDFQQSSRISKGNLAAFDGIWTGLDILQLVTVRFAQKIRLFAFCWQRHRVDEFEDTTARGNEVWEITDEQTGYDSWRNCAQQDLWTPIKCSLETRAFLFAGWSDLKRLIRADLWLDRMQGEVNWAASWKPDLRGAGWFPWLSGTIRAGLCSLQESRNGCTLQPQIRPLMTVSQLRLTTPPTTISLAERGFSFQLRLDWSGMMQVQKMLVYCEPVLNATQGDPQNALFLDDTNAALLEPSPRHPIDDATWAHALVTAAPCVPGGACFPYARIRSNSPPTLTLQFTASAHAELAFATGTHILTGVGDGSWYKVLDNGAAMGSITLTSEDPEVPGYENRFLLKVVPDLSAVEEFMSYIGVAACFFQPIVGTVGLPVADEAEEFLLLTEDDYMISY